MTSINRRSRAPSTQSSTSKTPGALRLRRAPLELGSPIGFTPASSSDTGSRHGSAPLLPTLRGSGRPAPAPASPTATSATSAVGPTRMDAFESFVRARSRAVRFPSVLPGPHGIATLCRALVAPPAYVVHAPGNDQGLFAVFNTHAEAIAALAAAGHDLLAVPALESDFEHVNSAPEHVVDLARLNRPIDVPPPADSSVPMQSSFSAQCSTHVASEAQYAPYTLSSNPPNPKSSFRANDWICTAATCGAHNFARNAACFNCRNPRVRNGPVADMYSPAPRLPISPRFAAGPSSSPAFGMPAAFNGGSRQPPVARATFPPPARQPPAPTYSVLTPSGRTFAQGGKVQNISSDPHNVIFLFWPANEPPPQQSQLRPPLVNHSNLPPIMNTGAKGPIEHQPGDWVCGVCQYLNWRRRKICQACFPYAEGNGDSVSATMQAERIALLANALTSPSPLGGVGQLSIDTGIPMHARPLRSAPLTPPMRTNPGFAASSSGFPQVSRSQSQFDLRSRYAPARTHVVQPIYQTSGHVPSFPPSPMSDEFDFDLPHEAPGSAFLPSFLADIVDSPTLSASSGSADLSSLEELSLGHSPAVSTRSIGDVPKTPAFVAANIWGFDGEERKAWGQLRQRSSQEMLVPGMRQ